MRNVVLGLCVLVIASVMNSSAHAADPAHGAVMPPPHANAGTTVHHASQPALPKPSPLGGSMIILIAGLFLAAAIVGPVVRYHAPEEAPEVSHDEHGHDAHGHNVHGHGH